MIKVVFDTNIYISAILFGGTPRRLLELAVQGDIQLYVSPDIIRELEGVLSRKKFGFSDDIVQNIVKEIEAISTTVIPAKRHHIVSRDADDNMIVDCAYKAVAHFIITGDSDLLSLSSYGKIRIVNAAEFLKMAAADAKDI